MSEAPASRDLVSIIISSYNYASYVDAAIESALAQTHPHTEVIVVDDGSTDGSREIIARHGDKICALLKENGGQASALNAGFALSKGTLVIFLDSDDVLLPTAVEHSLCVAQDERIATLHWNMWVADAGGGTSTQTVRPSLQHGVRDLRAAVLQGGADAYVWPPLSGNAWRRSFLERVLPIPEREFTTCPDLYLASLAPLYGLVATIAEPLGCWRYHGANAGFRDAFDDNLALGVLRAERCVCSLEEHSRSLELPFDGSVARRSSRWHQMKAAVEAIGAQVAEGEAFILVDEGHWSSGDTVAGRRRFLFPERDGVQWGLPADDADAVAEAQRLNGLGARYMVFPWPYLWWLDHYAGLNRYLRESASVVTENDRLVVFDLGNGKH